MFGLGGNVVHSEQVSVTNGRAEPDCSFDRHLPVSLDVMPYATLAQSCFGNDRSVGFLCGNSVVTSDSWVKSVGRVTGVNCQRKYMKTLYVTVYWKLAVFSGYVFGFIFKELIEKET